MVKFSPIALNFGYHFVLLVHFLGHYVHSVVRKCHVIANRIQVIKCIFFKKNHATMIFMAIGTCYSATYSARGLELS